MSDATLARMEHGKYVGVREESRHDGVCTLRKQTPYSLRGLSTVELYAAQVVLKLYGSSCRQEEDMYSQNNS